MAFITIFEGLKKGAKELGLGMKGIIAKDFGIGLASAAVLSIKYSMKLKPFNPW